MTATSIFTQLLSSDDVVLLRSSFTASVTENVADGLCTKAYSTELELSLSLPQPGVKPTL